MGLGEGTPVDKSHRESHFGIHKRDGWLVTGEVFEKFLGAAE